MRNDKTGDGYFSGMTREAATRTSRDTDVQQIQVEDGPSVN